MQPIRTPLQAEQAQADAIDRFAMIFQRWSTDPPTLPGWYQWRWPRGNAECSVEVAVRDGEIWAMFGKSLPVAEVAQWFPWCEWRATNIRRGGKHDPG